MQDDIERMQNVGSGDFPLKILRPTGVGVEEAPIPTPLSDNADLEGPEELVMRLTNREETSQDARVASSVNIMLEDEVETESKGLISPIWTPVLLQDGNTEPSQY